MLGSFNLIFIIELSSDIRINISATLFLTSRADRELKLILVLERVWPCRGHFYFIIVYDSKLWLAFQPNFSLSLCMLLSFPQLYVVNIRKYLTVKKLPMKITFSPEHVSSKGALLNISSPSRQVPLSMHCACLAVWSQNISTSGGENFVKHCEVLLNRQVFSAEDME